MQDVKEHIATNKLVPQLRFKEFDEEWGKYELEKLASKISVGIATEVRPFVSSKQEVPILRNQNIKAGYFDDSSMEYIIPEFDQSNKTKRVQKKDVLIVRTGSNMGNACVLPDKYEGSQTFTTLIVRPTKAKLDSEFLSSHINYFGLSEIQRLSAGGGKPNLNAGFLKRYRINVGQLVEQQKIASFLSAVDEKIQQLTKKKGLLEQYKKGVMQQLFSGQLRFKDENGNHYPDWEEKRLGEVGKIVSGLTYSPDDKNEDGVLVLRSSNVHGRKVTYDDNVFVNVEVGGFNPLEENDVLICVRNGSKRLIGKNALISGKAIGVAFGAFMTVYRSESNLFLFHYFDSVDYKKEVHKNLGATINSINGSDLKKFKIPFPSSPEQQKIAIYLSRIDTKIESVNNQITQTQTFKKGLLQQMFV